MHNIMHAVLLLARVLLLEVVVRVQCSGRINYELVQCVCHVSPKRT